MKKVMPDLAISAQTAFIGDLRTIRRFTRLWNKENIGGVEIFKAKEFYYKDADKSANFEKLFKFLGAYEDVINNDFKGVRRAWLYLNKNKASEIEDVNMDSFVLDNLNKVFWNSADGDVPEDLSISTSIVIETSNRALSIEQQNTISTLLDTNLSSEILEQNIRNNFSLILDSVAVTQEGSATVNKGIISNEANNTNVLDEDLLNPNDPWVDCLARYALRQSSLNSEITKIGIGTSTARPFRYSWGEITNTIVVDIKIPYKVFSLTDSIVAKISADLKDKTGDKSTNKQKTNFAVRRMSVLDIALEEGVIERNYIFWEDASTSTNSRFDSLWLYSSESNWVLKTEAFRNPISFGFTHKELGDYAISLIDTGYQKKKVSWYKKALAIIITIIAVVFAYYSGGKSLKLLAVAKIILFASLTLSLITLAFAVMGLTEWASAFSEVSKFIEPLTIIASIILLGDLVKTKINNVAERLLEESLSDILSGAVTDFADDIIDGIVKGANDLFSGTVNDASMDFTTKLINLYTMPDKQKLKSIQKRTADIKSQYEDLAKEMNQENDALRGFMNIYAKPATADWSYYSSLYDLPYERGGGLLAIGNIQRTTKQAMRKSEYNEPIFDSIRIK